jgi:hypothetical protein
MIAKALQKNGLMIWPAQAEWHGSEELAPIVRLCWSELSRDGTLVQFPRRRARLARRNHLIAFSFSFAV